MKDQDGQNINILNPSSREPVNVMRHVTFKSLPVWHLIPGLRG